MSKEENIIKNLFKLNYDKQKNINKLQQKIKIQKYHTKYMRNDVRVLDSEKQSLIKNIEKYEDLINLIICEFDCDEETINKFKNDVGLLNEDFILTIK